MTHDVFISYSHHDKSAADAVCAKLEQHGVRCWIAPRDVEPGAEWAGSIIHAISNTKIMVLVFSKNANDSPQIRKEVERAVNKGVIVVPLRIEDVAPTESLEYFMSNVHWLDALSPPLEKHLDHLAGTVKMMLVRIENRDEPKPAENVSAKTPSGKSLARHSRKLSLRAGILVGATLLIVLLVAAYFSKKTVPPPQFAYRYDLQHTDPFFSAVFSVAFSPDSHLLASGGTSHDAVIWDVSTGVRLRPPIDSFSGFVPSVAFSPDGRLLATGTSRHNIKLWDPSTGKLARALPVLPIQYVDGVQYTNPLDASLAATPPTMAPPFAFNPSAEGGRRGDSAPNGARKADQPILLSFSLSSDYIDSVAFSPDGRWIASGSAESNVAELWDAATGTFLRALPANTNSVTAVAFNPKGDLLASASADKTIKIWDPAVGNLICPLSGHTGPVRGIAFSPDGRWLASASEDHTVKLWDVAACHEIRTISGHTDSVHAVAFSPDGLWLASGGADEIVRIWNSATGKPVATLQHDSKWIESIAFSPDGRTLATGNQGGTVTLWHRTN